MLFAPQGWGIFRVPGPGWGPKVGKIVGEIAESRPLGIPNRFKIRSLFWTVFFAILDGTDGFMRPFLSCQDNPQFDANLGNRWVL